MILMSQVRQLNLVDSHPFLPFLQAHQIALHFNRKYFWALFLSFFLLIKLCNYLSKECGLYKASDLLLGDHVCEKSHAVKWTDCP